MMILGWGYSSGPDPRHTGGFQEKTCARCHSDFPLNEGRLTGGNFIITGVPRSYEPGSRYPLSVLVEQPALSVGGFELSARFASSGKQAGELLSVDSSTRIREAEGIQYITHTRSGSRALSGAGGAEFRFVWVAPDTTEGPVYFNAAGNAGNGDDDTTGDYVYTAGAFSNLVGTPETSESVIPTSPSREPAPGRRSSSSRFMHIPAPTDLSGRSMEIHIEHRFIQALADSSPGSAFGIDFGANIFLGFNYALSDRLSASVGRARFDQIISMAGTYEIKTEKDAPFQLSLLGGVEGRENFQRQYSPFLQLASSFDYGRLRLLAAPTVILNSRDDRDAAFFRNPVKPESNHTLSLGVGLDFVVTPGLSVAAEAVPRLAGFGGFGSRDPAFSGGIKLSSWGHVFTIMASTSRTFTPAQYGVNNEKDFSLGFNIYRRIR